MALDQVRVSTTSGLTREEMLEQLGERTNAAGKVKDEMVAERQPDTSRQAGVLKNELSNRDEAIKGLERGVAEVDFYTILLFTDGEYRMIKTRNTKGGVPHPSQIIGQFTKDGNVYPVVLDSYNRDAIAGVIGVFVSEKEAKETFDMLQKKKLEAKKMELDYLASKIGEEIAKNIKAATKK